MSAIESRKQPVILLIAEAVTLAHFARIVTLAKSLASSEYKIVVASDPRFINLENPFQFEFQPIYSIPSSDFAQALAQGKPLYSIKELTRYVEADLALIDKIKPDIVIGDFRLSLSVSAPLRNVPYAAVVNAYWSPYADTDYPIPDLPLTKVLGVNIAQQLFNLVRPLVFAMHAKPLNKVRKRYGLSPLGHDLRQAYTWADFTLYADIPEVVPTIQKPPNHYYLGPILWSTKTPPPEWWDKLPDDKPIVFVTLGSSGQADLLPVVLQALSGTPITIIAATAGKIHLTDPAPNVFVKDYLPIDIASQRSQLVISNGGSLTTYQALSNGVPVIGIAGNMDQLLNMQAIERLGAGITIRTDRTTQAGIQQAANSILHTSSHTQAAEQIAQVLRRHDPAKRFREIVTDMLN